MAKIQPPWLGSSQFQALCWLFRHPTCNFFSPINHLHNIFYLQIQPLCVIATCELRWSALNCVLKASGVSKRSMVPDTFWIQLQGRDWAMPTNLQNTDSLVPDIVKMSIYLSFAAVHMSSVALWYQSQYVVPESVFCKLIGKFIGKMNIDWHLNNIVKMSFCSCTHVQCSLSSRQTHSYVRYRYRYVPELQFTPAHLTVSTSHII